MHTAIIFDLDGTLVDTLDDLAWATNTILERHGYPLHDRDSYRKMVGNGISALIERALPEVARTHQLRDALRFEMVEYYAAHALDRSRAYPGIEALLERMEEVSVPFAVVTNKPQALAESVIRGLFPSRSFVAILGDSPDFPRKPDPAGALHVASRMGYAPSNILCVGDSEVDILLAQGAGMRSVAVTWGFRDRASLCALHPDHVIDEPGQISDLLQV